MPTYNISKDCRHQREKEVFRKPPTSLSQLLSNSVTKLHTKATDKIKHLIRVSQCGRVRVHDCPGGEHGSRKAGLVLEQ